MIMVRIGLSRLRRIVVIVNVIGVWFCPVPRFDNLRSGRTVRNSRALRYRPAAKT